MITLAEGQEVITLVDFLLARIAEDEKWARAPHNGSYRQRRFSPERILATCEAYRRIIADHIRPSGWCDYEHDGTDPDLCVTLRALAAIYADHPDYREEWS